MPGPNRIRVRSINHAANSKKIALCLVPRSSIFALCRFNLGHLPTRHRKEFIAKRRAHDQRQHSNYVWTGSESFRSEPDRIGFCLHGTVWNRSSCFTCNRLEPVRYESKRIQNWICESADPFRTSSRMVACKQKAYPVRYSDRIRLESFPVNIARDLKTDILESFKNGTHSGLFQFRCKKKKKKNYRKCMENFKARLDTFYHSEYIRPQMLQVCISFMYSKFNSCRENIGSERKMSDSA